MPGRLPEAADFPASLTLSITPPPPNQQPTNILILLHGLGDSHSPFTHLGQQLNLPETACLSVRAPLPMPDVMGLGREGYHWGGDIVLDNSTGGVDLVDVPYNKSVTIVLDEIILKGLVRKCGYALRDIIIYGFGQGGSVGLAVASELARRPPPSQGASSTEQTPDMGGVVSVGGPLPSAYRTNQNDKAKENGAGANSTTPVLVLHGSSQSAIAPNAVGHIRNVFKNAEEHQWKKSGDSMPASREEMLPVMRFFAKRLRSRAGVPSGAVEII